MTLKDLIKLRPGDRVYIPRPTKTPSYITAAMTQSFGSYIVVNSVNSGSIEDTTGFLWKCQDIEFVQEYRPEITPESTTESTYEILMGKPDELSSIVTQYLSTGWALHGSPYHVESIYHCQAVIKPQNTLEGIINE